MADMLTAETFDTDPYAVAYPEMRSFWAAAAEGRLLVKACEDCDRAHWYPRVICPLCRSEKTEWRDASGRGTLYAFSEVRRAEVPYILAYVRLAEGPIIMTNIVECDADSLRIDQPVFVRFRPTLEGRLVPMFSSSP
jgi:uncharacterized OB-fold protein